MVCLYDALSHYIAKTSQVRTTQFLFITTNQFTPVAPATVSRWVKDILREARVDTNVYKPHTTRSAAASKFAYSMQNLSATLKLGGYYLRKPVYFGKKQSKRSEIVHKAHNNVMPTVVKLANFKLKKALASRNRNHNRVLTRAPHTEMNVSIQQENFAEFIAENCEHETGNVDIPNVTNAEIASSVSSHSFNCALVDRTIETAQVSNPELVNPTTSKQTFFTLPVPASPYPHQLKWTINKPTSSNTSRWVPAKTVEEDIKDFTDDQAHSDDNSSTLDEVLPEDSMSMVGSVDNTPIQFRSPRSPVRPRRKVPFQRKMGKYCSTQDPFVTLIRDADLHLVSEDEQFIESITVFKHLPKYYDFEGNRHLLLQLMLDSMTECRKQILSANLAYVL